ncbi:MAG: hypothetical protein ACHQ50_15240, partial [Fimbriimonadales bacterium]
MFLTLILTFAILKPEFLPIHGFDGEAISQDGNWVIGSVRKRGHDRAALWNRSSGIMVLPLLPRFADGYPNFVSRDGSCVVGTCTSGKADALRMDWFVWRRGKGTAKLFPGSSVQATAPAGAMTPPIESSPTWFMVDAMSADGSTIAGGQYVRGPSGPVVGFYDQLNIGDVQPAAVSDDGKTLLLTHDLGPVGGGGNGAVPHKSESLVWSRRSGFVRFGKTGLVADAMSGDGTLFCGRDHGKLCRWNLAGNSEPLGGLGSNRNIAIKCMSADGSTIVGGDLTSLMIWRKSLGMVALKGALLKRGLRGVARWKLQSCESVSG